MSVVRPCPNTQRLHLSWGVEGVLWITTTNLEPLRRHSLWISHSLALGITPSKGQCKQLFLHCQDKRSDTSNPARKTGNAMPHTEMHCQDKRSAASNPAKKTGNAMPHTEINDDIYIIYYIMYPPPCPGHQWSACWGPCHAHALGLYGHCKNDVLRP